MYDYVGPLAGGYERNLLVERGAVYRNLQGFWYCYELFVDAVSDETSMLGRLVVDLYVSML